MAGFQAAEAKLVSRAARFGGRIWGDGRGMADQIGGWEMRPKRRMRHKSPSHVLDRLWFADRDGSDPPMR